MHDEERVASPCVRNCCLDEANICMGCHRSLEEIVRWSTASAREQREILAESRLRADRRRGDGGRSGRG
jgi:predicted Fe-S protein YdhL (DUF1289 family)